MSDEATAASQMSESEVLRSEVARLNSLIADQAREQESSARIIADLKLQMALLSDPKPIWERAIARARRVPASLRRRYHLRELRRTVNAERPEVSEAELERRRLIIDRFLAESEAATTLTPQQHGGLDRSLLIATSIDPIVSVIIPVHNAIDELLDCLTSFQNHPPATPFEILIANDCSDEEKFAPVRAVHGVRVLDNSTNLGFLMNCNAAVDHARGDLLWFLNSDTEIIPNSMDALVRTLEDPQTAIAGSRLMYADGSLQEAGGIVWQDGSAWNYGRGTHPNDPRVNYARRVDYVSGASLMVRRSVFELLGRFDTAFSPAYYEDTDLCMAATEAGYRVMYQPASVVIHHEGASHGTDTADTGSMKHHQVLNHETFYRKWHLELASHRPNGVEPELEKERDRRHRVLVLDARMLTPDQDSGSLRMLNMMRALQPLGCKVTFVPQNLIAEEPYASELQQIGIEVIGSPHARGVREFLQARGSEFDAVILSRLEVAAPLMSTVRAMCPNSRIIYDTVDLHFLRQVREFRLNGEVSGGFDHEETQELEIMCTQQAQATFVCSTSERDLLSELVPEASIHILGNIHHVTPTTTPANDRSGLLFVGGFEHPPNIDAMEWFVREVLPLITAKSPETVLHMIGSKMPPEIHELAGHNVRVHGYVPDLEPFYETARIVIAPLRFGAGVKGKVTQALSNGVPCVGTTIAFEGSDLVDGKDVIVADDAATFAAECLRLQNDDQLWKELREHGLMALEENFGLARATAQLAEGLGLSVPD